MKNAFLCFLFFVALLGLALPVVAQDASVKQRMEQRLPAIDELKQRKIVGENNRGYLELRTKASADETRLVDAENRDRDSVYDSIAQQAGTSKDAVGRRRAAQIATNSARGVWIQAADGSWSVK